MKGKVERPGNSWLLQGALRVNQRLADCSQKPGRAERCGDRKRRRCVHPHSALPPWNWRPKQQEFQFRHIKGLCVALIGLTQALGSAGQLAEQVTNIVQHQFKYELHNAESGALYRSSGGNSSYNDLVLSVFVDSEARVWVGTQNGLAVYDGGQWVHRTFRLKGLHGAERAALRLLRISECGPERVAEGPPGTIWLAGDGCGVWRFREGRYSEVGSGHTGSVLGLAVDSKGWLWVVTRDSVYRSDGQAWDQVLCPYLAHEVHRELPELYGIAIATNGNIYVGGTVYGEPQGPWEHEGPTWMVDQERKKRNGGPPMAALFEFDGRMWRAFGPPHGLKVKWAIPESGEEGRVLVKTPRGRYYIREGESWKPTNGVHASGHRRWILRERKGGFSLGRAELLFRDGDRLVSVQPTDHQTGEALDLGSEQLVVLHMAEDKDRDCVWLGTMHGLYRIWLERQRR